MSSVACSMSHVACRTPLVICASTLHWPQLPRHMLCTAAAPHPSLQSSAGLQLSQIAVDGNAAEKALLADVTEAHPDASYVELLRLFKVRRSVGDAHSQRAWCICACCALPAHSLLAAAARDPVCPLLPTAALGFAHSLLLAGQGRVYGGGGGGGYVRLPHVQQS